MRKADELSTTCPHIMQCEHRVNTPSAGTVMSVVHMLSVWLVFECVMLVMQCNAGEITSKPCAFALTRPRMWQHACLTLVRCTQSSTHNAASLSSHRAQDLGDGATSREQGNVHTLEAARMGEGMHTVHEPPPCKLMEHGHRAWHAYLSGVSSSMV